MATLCIFPGTALLYVVSVALIGRNGFFIPPVFVAVFSLWGTFIWITQDEHEECYQRGGSELELLYLLLRACVVLLWITTGSLVLMALQCWVLPKTERDETPPTESSPLLPNNSESIPPPRPDPAA